MNGTKESERSSPGGEPSVLANLPRTRPQRSSPRRTAARTAPAARRAPAAGKAPGERKAPSKARGAESRRGSASSRGSKSSGVETRPTQARARAGSGEERPREERTRRSQPPTARSGRAVTQEVPRQGFECEGDSARGAVTPPGSTELVASAVEIVGELAKAGISTGERLLKDVFSRISR